MHMNVINIGSRLWFDETPMGGTLNFQASEGPNGLLFQVGISFVSLRACSTKLGHHFSSWKIRDGSLAVYGDHEELSLHFSSADGQGYRADHVLRGKELKAFRYAVDALAGRPGFAFN